VADRITVLPGSNCHTNNISWNPFEVYLIMLSGIAYGKASITLILNIA
jgi:hypothetical protein